MEFVKTLLEEQPMFALFLTIAIGYVVGEINLKGFSLGVGAVLFVALATGWFAPKSAPAPMVGTLGLSLFLYAVGAQYGKQFFLGFSSAYGRRANLIALVLPGTHIAVVVHVRRGDADLLARPGLILEYGDRVGLLANPADFGALRTFFGNSIKGTAEFSYISIGLGMALGFSARRGQYPAAGCGQDRPGVIRCADRRADFRKTASHRRFELDRPAVGQSCSAQSRADAVSRPGRHGIRPEVCRDGRRRAWKCSASAR